MGGSNNTISAIGSNSTMLPIQTPNELLQRSPPPVARASSTETLETSVSGPQKTVEDSFHKAGEDHSVVDESIHGRSTRGALQLEEFTRLFKAVVAGSLLEAGAAAEETAAEGRSESPFGSPWAKVDRDGALTLESPGPASVSSDQSPSVRGTSLEEEMEVMEEEAAAAAWAAADLMAALIAASSLGAGALLLARMAGAASR